MAYFVKEAFSTLQGEGFHTGRQAVFLRFAGCNLWSGREEDRSDAVCPFCDTQFVGTDGPGGGVFETAESLSRHVTDLWTPKESARPFVVCTGGEPLLQLDEPLVSALQDAGFEVAVETNGTIVPPPGIDWTCVSPKAGSRPKLLSGDELKLVFPQAGNGPSEFENLDFGHFYLQPMDGASIEKGMLGDNTLAVIR